MYNHSAIKRNFFQVEEFKAYKLTDTANGNNKVFETRSEFVLGGMKGQ